MRIAKRFDRSESGTDANGFESSFGAPSRHPDLRTSRVETGAQTVEHSEWERGKGFEIVRVVSRDHVQAAMPAGDDAFLFALTRCVTLNPFQPMPPAN